MEKVNYKQLKNQIIDILKNKKTAVLATCDDNNISARSLSLVNNDLIIYFQTDKKFNKCQQIKNNPNVAIAADNVQIEGIAQIIGHPYDDNNKKFLELFKKKHYMSYRLYSKLNDEVVIKIDSKKITLWQNNSGKLFRYYLYPEQKKAIREHYLPEKN
jgi:general stress protein 26